MKASNLPGTITLLGFLVATLIGAFYRLHYQGAALTEIGFFFLLSISLCIFSFRRESTHQFARSSLFIFLVTLLVWTAFSTIIHASFSAVLQATIYFSFITFALTRLSLPTHHIKASIIILLAVITIQLFVDITLPNRSLSNPLDYYSGTFIMANNKARFLAYVLPLAILIAANENKTSMKVFGVVAAACGLVSFYIGYSHASYAFAAVAILLAVLFKRLYVGIAALLIVLSLLYFAVQIALTSTRLTTEQEALLLFNATRFIDTQYGVAGIYAYGLQKLDDYLYLFGIGLGQFSTRAAQMFSTQISSNIPETMITYGELFKTKAPYGLSSIFVLLIEGGVFALAILAAILRKLSAFNDHLLVRYMAYYVIIMALYSPVFFEFSEFYAYLFSLIVAKSYLRANHFGPYGSKSVTQSSSVAHSTPAFLLARQ